ncbi:DNA metabolism protein [Candidatus Magnetoovum chiemensis]|nr:DNA metabolism protein [Candidatus Magnetoovum chiemensis]
MTIYTYDGTIEALFAVLHDCIFQCEPLNIIRNNCCNQESLFHEHKNVQADKEKLKTLEDLIIRCRLSQTSLDNMEYAFYSEAEGIEMAIYKYLELGLKLAGKSLDSCLSNDAVYTIHCNAKKVQRQAHKYIGLIRFKELEDDMLYSAIEPDYNILPLIGEHFTQRLSNMRWIIHDLRRNIAIVYDKTTVKFIDAYRQDHLKVCSNEKEIANQWREYFEVIAISDRYNPKLQRQNLPLKYRKHLTEYE